MKQVSPQLTAKKREEVQSLAKSSLSLYEEMEHLYRKIATLPLEDSAQIAPFMQDIESLQHQAAELDKQLIAGIEEIERSAPLSAPLSSLLSARNERIKRALQCNRELVENAGRHKAVLQNELAAMNKNRQAISGYRAAQIPAEQRQAVQGAY